MSTREIWLLQIGEPLPIDVPEARLLRTGLLAEYLLRKGWEVRWWASRFDHQRKRFRDHVEDTIGVRPGYTIELLNGGGYRRNVSFKRLRDHQRVAVDFAERAAGRPSPAAVLASFPSIELAERGTRFATARGVPCIVDARDQWPDSFLEVVPRALRPVARPCLFPLDRRARAAFGTASGICAITPEFLAWAAEKAGRAIGPTDSVFPMACEPHGADEWDDSTRRLRESLRLDDDAFVVSFVGTFERQFDIAPVANALRKTRQNGIDVTLLMCGDGARRRRWEAVFNGIDNVHFLGWLHRRDLGGVLGVTSVGLAPYVDSPDFRMSLPNKVIEYLSAGVPVLSAVDGAVGRILRDQRCGSVYHTPDELAAQLGELATDPSKRTAMGTAGKAFFAAQLAAPIVYPAFVEYVERLITEASRD